MNKFLATWFGAGLSPKAPGTAGSAVAAIMVLPILMLPQGWAWLTGAMLLVSMFGVPISNRYMDLEGAAHDPKEIVIDEVAGQWLTYCTFFGLVALMMRGGDASHHAIAALGMKPELLLAGFVLFRVFDIIKPWPISWADKKVMGGLGVMLDDWLASIMAGIMLFMLAIVWPILTGDIMVPHVP